MQDAARESRRRSRLLKGFTYFSKYRKVDDFHPFSIFLGMKRAAPPEDSGSRFTLWGKISLFTLIMFGLLSSAAFAATYTYDELNRLVAVDYDNGDRVEYVYDKNGNMLSSKYTKADVVPPVAPPVSGTGVVHHFEDGTTQGWTSQGDGVQLVNSQEIARSGKHSLKVTNRTAAWQGPILDATQWIEKGKSYRIKAAVRLAQGEESTQIMMTIRRTLADGSSFYDHLNTQTVTADGWAVLEGVYMTSQEASNLSLYLESTSDTAVFYLDDVSIDVYVAPAPSTETLLHDFEDGTTQGWSAQGDGVVAANSQEAASAGSRSLKISGRTASWQGPILNLTSFMKKGATYDISGKIKLSEGTPSSDILLTMNRKAADGTDYYENISASHVTADGWAFFKGVYTFTGEVTHLTVYMESANATASFYLDEFQVKKHEAAPPVISHDFEDGSLQGWNALGEGVVLSNSDEAASSGQRSLKVTNRTAEWQGPLLNLTNALQADQSYTVRAAFRLLDDSAPANLLMTIHRKTAEGADYYDNVSVNVVKAGEWAILEGPYSYSGDASELSLYVESSDATVGFYVDDFTISRRQP
ncbi:carbohydrate binding domain-containing protein [Paenibacillus sp. Leaf72]|uniref:carbohydrate binding domain-containing protein n=1 Tax=Paenibacillus sp. Leaf72 TaxID=1736234 RepID=UPI0006FAE224|nr:carbohydrate binding domain-containing protein [Paenibacillus sp. Leaf72]KQN97053.1 hypothetical protein ASF12_23580 [Paenibacillus sp. Leaf72]